MTLKHKNIRRALAGVVCLVMLAPAGCKKGYFDNIPDNIITVDNIFENRGQTERWLAGLYSSIPDIWAAPYTYQYMGISDEIEFANWGVGTAPSINNGAITADGSPSNFSAYYEKIRLASIFLEKIDNNKEILALPNGPELIKQYKGEARFMRAYYYWLMMKELGPVVLMPLKSASINDDFQIPRSSWDECVNFVLAEMAIAKADVPLQNYAVGSSTELDPAQTGRINKLIVSSVESQILLYHASPLFNGNTELGDFKNLDGKQLFNQTYDGTRWKKAADASKAAIDMAILNGKGLFKVADDDPFRAAYLSCRNMFWDGWKTEGIWLRSASDENGSWERHCSPRSISGGAWNGMGVLQNLVDDFRMKDGSAISNNSSYNENTYPNTEGVIGTGSKTTTLYVAGTNQMYRNREARFYVDVTFNGSVNPGVAKANTPTENNSRVEFFKTGSSGKDGNARDWPKTGYTARKNIIPNINFNPSVTNDRPAMLIRLAELYLNYAEALNEADPGNPDILKYLNEIRVRGGLPALTGTLSQEDMRKEIRLERRIELCYESGIRYFDVRRWKIADKPGSNQGGAMYGMNIDAGTSLSDPAFHVRTVATVRKAWQRKYYFFPYGQNEMDRNKQLVQFPGY